MIKVAAYCRVSTDKEDQTNSLASQKRYFREYIEQHADWELYEVYADEGVTGTSTKKRVQFNRMMTDAFAGRFKLIITKEVSRFSRNILDTIACTRDLKSLGVGIVFMSDGFCTLDPDAELRLSIMGSIAQEESRKISTRVKWGQTRQMERGIVFGRTMLGYDVEKGSMTVNPDGAEIVKQIFYKYGIEKKGSTVIARELQEAGIKTSANNHVWNSSQVLKILKNEKYVGDLIQKKTITPDYLSHAKKYNHGEEDLIIHTDHHEPIISRELWELVQAEIKNRNRHNGTATTHSVRYIFSGKIRCGECGANFVSRVKKRKDGSCYRRWGCYTATRYGTKKTDVQGHPVGCDIGKLIRDDIAIEILKTVIRCLPVKFNQIIQNVASLTTNAIQCSSGSNETPQKICQQIQHLQERKTRTIDAFLSGLITQEELQLTKSHYDTQIVSLQDRIGRFTASNALDARQISAMLESITNCKDTSDAYMRALLEYIIVHKDSTIDVKLNQLATVWKFQLIKR